MPTADRAVAAFSIGLFTVPDASRAAAITMPGIAAVAPACLLTIDL